METTQAETATKEIKSEANKIDSWRVNRTMQCLDIMSGVEQFNALRRNSRPFPSRMKYNYFMIGKSEALYEIGRLLNPEMKSCNLLDGTVVNADVDEGEIKDLLSGLRKQYNKDIKKARSEEENVKEERLKGTNVERVRGKLRAINDVEWMLLLYEPKTDVKLEAKKRS